MKLATKTMLLFIAVIVFQAGLTVSVLSYFFHQQNKEMTVAEMKKEARVVYDNYIAWKTRLWKNLITLKSNQALKRLTRLLYHEDQESDIKSILVDIANDTKELLITSGVDFVVVKTEEHLVIRSISDNKLMFSNLLFKFQGKSRPYPHLENIVLDGNLTLTGIINLGTELNFKMDIILIKVINQQFVNKLSSNPQAEVFFYIRNNYFQAEIEEVQVGSVITFNKLNHAHNILTDLVFGNKRFYGIVEKVATFPYSTGKEFVFLATMIPSETYSPSTILIYKLIFTVFILGALLALILSWFLSFNITRPVKNLLLAMNRVKEGKFDIQISGRYSSELQELSLGFNKMASNLNDQKQTTDRYLQEISSLKDYNERIIDSISTGIISLNNELKIEKVNRGFLEAFEKTEEELLGKHIRKTSLSFIDDDILDQITTIIQNRTGSFVINKRIPPKTVYEIKLYHVTSSHSEPGCVLFFNNISKKLELDERILQAEKLSSISMLSAGVAHEINNPLSSIMSNVQFLVEEEADEDKAASLNWIKQETRRIGDIIKRLLDFSSSNQSGDAETNVNEEIRRVVDLVKFSIKEKVVIDCQLDDTLPRTSINQTEFKQVIINLLNNSVQASGENGKIEIKTKQIGENKIQIAIKDSGDGMPEEMIPKIFDPFFTTKPTGVGTGLGLSVVYGIIKNHEGNIQVVSELGKGSTFVLTIPALGA